MTAETRRENRRLQLRHEIITAASKAFANEGYEQLSMRRLATEIGCAPGTLYLYFRSKDDLLGAVVEESFAELLRSLRGITAESDPMQRLKLKMRAYIEFGLRNPSHYKCAFVLQSAQMVKGPYRPHPAFTELVNDVRASAKKGMLDEADVELASQVLWSSIHGLTSLLIARPNFPWVKKDKLIHEVIETATAGVARRGLVQDRATKRSARAGRS